MLLYKIYKRQQANTLLKYNREPKLYINYIVHKNYILSFKILSCNFNTSLKKI